MSPVDPGHHEKNDSPEYLLLRQELEAARALVEKQERQIALLAGDQKAFLDNMSVQLCTPLDSISILARLLETNAEGNLTEQQVEYATVIGRSSADLRSLIEELLALARSEDKG